VVDDEPAVQRALARELRREYEVVFASSYEAALGMLSTDQPFAAIVSDYLIGRGATGLDLLAEVAERSPRCLRVLFSGSIVPASAVDAIKRGVAHVFVPKPWEAGRVSQTLRDGISAPHV
jgi:DNA-binding NtrC family response regulator